MKYLLILLLLLALPVQAEHHRDHAIDRLDITLYRLDQALERMDAYAACAMLTGVDTGRLPLVKGYTISARNLAAQARGALLDNSMPLQDIRRLLTQPAERVNGVNQTASTSTYTFWTKAIIQRTMEPGSTCEGYSYANGGNSFAAIKVYLTVAMYQLTEAVWHVTDAILEEQFGQ